jgi:hypothetical protein
MPIPSSAATPPARGAGSRYPRLGGWLVLVPALCCLSCSGGGGLNPVRGKVLYKNQPLQGALVTFHPRGANAITAVPPVGLTGEDGTFTVTTGQQEGAPAGAYVVTLICSAQVARKDKKTIFTKPPRTRDRFQGAYAHRETSRFRVEIKKGVNQLEPFNLN